MIKMRKTAQAVFHLSVVIGVMASCQSPKPTPAPMKQLRRSVFKVLTTSQNPNYSVPWNYLDEEKSTGSAFFLGGAGIVTNAHVVANARYIEVERDGDAAPSPARIKFIAHDCDLAILETLDGEAEKTASPLKLGGVPTLLSPITTAGFPTGGDQISVTNGIISRLRSSIYAHSGVSEHLMIQVDSAINPGNSGGPVFQDGKVIGVAFQSYRRADNIGYIIPVPVIERFIEDIADGTYDGHPELGIIVSESAMNNPAARAAAGTKAAQQGVMVNYVYPWSMFHGELQAGDIIMEIEGKKVGSDSRMELYGERVGYEVLLDLKQIGEDVEMKVLRQGKLEEIEVKASHGEPHYFGGNRFAESAPYLVYGGLVFTTLGWDMLNAWDRHGWTSAPVTLKYLQEWMHFHPQLAQAEDVITLDRILAHPINQYEQASRGAVLMEVNGQHPKSLKELTEILQKVHTGLVDFHFENDEERIVLDAAQVEAKNPEILKKYAISAPFRLLPAGSSYH